MNLKNESAVSFLLNLVTKIVLGVMMLGVSSCIALRWYLTEPHSPDLNPASASAIIRERPEFNQSRRIVRVSSTARGADSLNNCCYEANFQFTTNGTADPIDALADFRFWEGRWHLNSFEYGNGDSRKWIPISSDRPKGQH